MNYITDSGIPGMGKIPWGSHFCQLYSDRHDFIDSLTLYFAAGIRNHEQCVWITTDSYDAMSGAAELGRVIPRLDEMIKDGQVQIRNFDECYARGSARDELLERWLTQEQEALVAGYQGLRIAGNMAFVTRMDWDSFMAYENAAHRTFNNRRILALCSYSLNNCQPTDIFEVVRNHLLTLCRKDGHWEMLDVKPHVFG
jgi:hypothetical protein